VNLACPACKFEIPDQLIDLSEESAFCPRCQTYFNCGEWIEQTLIAPENLVATPAGVWFEQTRDGFKLGVSLRSYKGLIIGPVACLWTALMAFFTWGIFHAAALERVVLLAFMVPFYLIGLYLWSRLLMTVGGKAEVVVEGSSGSVFTGVGTAGRRRCFDWDQIKKTRIARFYQKNRETLQEMSLEGDKAINFARGRKLEQLRFMLIALRLMLRNRGKSNQTNGQ
jgi:hypothetical protein